MRARSTACVLAVPATVAATAVLMARGALVLDTGIGRRCRQLGPISMTVNAPP